MSVADAEKTLSGLQRKRDASVARGVELGEERSKISFAAHADGDQAARRKLDKAAVHDSELRSLDAAIAEAAARVEKAKATETQSRQKSWRASCSADALVQYAQSLDDANTIRVEMSRAIADGLLEMRSLAQEAGLHVPSHDQFLALGSRAEHTAGMLTLFAREIAEHLAPNQRRTHMSYIAQWRDAIAKAAAALAGEGKEQEAA